MVLLVSGCGASSGDVKAGAEAAKGGESFAARLGKVTNNSLHFAIETHVQPGTLHNAALAVSDGVENGTSIREALAKVAASDDPYGAAIVQATCYGLGNVASYQDDPNAGPAPEQSWIDFVIKQVHVLLPHNPVARINGAVKDFVTTANLADINPRAAAIYYNECTKR